MTVCHLDPFSFGTSVEIAAGGQLYFMYITLCGMCRNTVSMFKKKDFVKQEEDPQLEAFLQNFRLNSEFLILSTCSYISKKVQLQIDT